MSHTSPATQSCALVTGASSGIGKAIARKLLATGMKIAVADLRTSTLEQAFPEAPNRSPEILRIRLDVRSEENWASALDQLQGRWGRLDICVNCAGVSRAGNLVDLTLSDWRAVFEVNLDGVFLGTKHALRAMLPQKQGCILNIGSAAGLKPLAGNAAYGTSKAALRFLTQVAAIEAAPHGIRVNSISPGAVATPLWRNTPFWPADTGIDPDPKETLDVLVRDHGFATAESIAEIASFLVGDQARHIHGVDLPVDDGFSIG